MLEMRPGCERCGADLPAGQPDAFVCSLECTFCAMCDEAMDEPRPNCGSELTDRPTRAAKWHDKYPPLTARTHKP